MAAPLVELMQGANEPSKPDAPAPAQGHDPLVDVDLDAPPTVPAKAAPKGNPQDQFMDAYEDASEQHPADPAQRRMGNVSTEITRDPIDPSTVHVQGFYADHPAQGHGGKAMQQLTAMADQSGADMTLNAIPQDHPAGRIPQDKLDAFYKAHGFEPADTESSDTGQPGAMLRRAQGADVNAPPLAGLPQQVKVNGQMTSFGPAPAARQAASNYARSVGLNYDPPNTYEPITPSRGAMIANAYENMQHTPEDPETANAYGALIGETGAQLKAIQATGLNIQFIKPGMKDPYAGNPRLATLDVRNKNHLWVFPTEGGFGGTHVNIGLNKGNEVGAVLPHEAINALKSKGVNVLDHEVRMSGTEPTLVARTSRPLTDQEASDTAAQLGQDSIAQHNGTEGKLHGPGKDKWNGGKFDPEQFMLPGGETAASVMKHPLLQPTGRTIDGRKMLANDEFRIVHDYFGHVKEGVGFRADGEFNAYRIHKPMYSALAQKALATETLGQNAYVNYGPNGAKNRTASAEETEYAPQKAGLLPDHVIKSADVPAMEWAAAYAKKTANKVASTPEEVQQHLTEQEQKQMLRGGATKRIMAAFKELPHTAEYAAAALAGKAKRGWYKDSAEAITNVFGADAPRFTALLAAMSPQTSVQMNFHNALRTFVNWDRAGRPGAPGSSIQGEAAEKAIRDIMEQSSLKNPKSRSKSNVLDAWFNNSVKALTDKDPENLNKLLLSGPKVHSFYHNLMGNVHEVTNDAWMASFAKIDSGKLGGGKNNMGPGKSATYLAVSAKVREAAKMLSHMTGEQWTPREVQETVWSWAKTAYERAQKDHKEMGSLGASIPELVKHGEITDDLIRATPAFHDLFGSADHAGFLAGSKYGENAARLAARARPTAAPSAPSKAEAAIRQALQPRLDRAAERVESVRQERLASGEDEE
jgi:hypothetical protein